MKMSEGDATGKCATCYIEKGWINVAGVC